MMPLIRPPRRPDMTEGEFYALQCLRLYRLRRWCARLFEGRKCERGARRGAPSANPVARSQATAPKRCVCGVASTSVSASESAG